MRGVPVGRALGSLARSAVERGRSGGWRKPLADDLPDCCRAAEESFRRLNARGVWLCAHTAFMGGGLFLRVLGPLRLERDGQDVDIGGARQREVLARLAVAGGQPVTAEALLADVWGPAT